MKNRNNNIAAGEKIYFTPTSEDDLDFVLDSESNPENKNFIRNWTREEHINAVRNETYAHWLIKAKDDNRNVGYIILTGVGNVQRSLEFKRIVITEKGNGFGIDSVNLLKKIAFELMNVNRLWLEVIDFNERAHNLYAFLGFVEEGKLRECEIINGKLISLYVMSILKREYEEMIKRKNNLLQ